MKKTVERPLAIDLFTGLHGWAEGLVAEGWRVKGFDIEDMCAQFGVARPAHVELIIQDVLTLHGSQFKDAALIVASPPCQAYSYMAMPWKKGKAIAAGIRADMTGEKLAKLNQLFNACFRIQREACEAAGHHIPMVVENVRGAQPWVGRAAWNFGSFYLWGDVPALMPIARGRLKAAVTHRPDNRPFLDFRATKNNGGSWFAVAHNTTSGKGQNPDGRKTDGAPHIRSGESHTKHLTNPSEHVKQGGDWFAEARKGGKGGTSASFGSKSYARKASSATIAKIPPVLARWIGATYKPA